MLDHRNVIALVTLLSKDGYCTNVTESDGVDIWERSRMINRLSSHLGGK